MSIPSVTVLVPTYSRSEMIAGCLDALLAQDIEVHQVIVVVRPDDNYSRAVLRLYPKIEEVLVAEPGLLAALSAGARRATGEVVVTTDDDARGRPDWLRTLLGHYSNPAVGAVGGKDIVHHPWGFERENFRPVGRVSPLGRMTGNHHLGSGTAREVQFLKGVNSSFRRQLLMFPETSRGSGLVATDLACSLNVYAMGWKVIFDPNAIVDHFPAARNDLDRRVIAGERRASEAILNGAYNESFVLMSLMPRMRVRRWLYTYFVGDRATVGIFRSGLARARKQTELAGARRVCAAAVRAAFRDSRKSPLRMLPPH